MNFLICKIQLKTKDINGYFPINIFSLGFYHCNFYLFKENIRMFANMDLILLAPVQTFPKQKDQKTVGQQKSSGAGRMANLNEILKANRLQKSNITQQGRIKCQRIAQTLNWDSISLIIVSPLQSCLQTCRELLKLSSKKIEVSVEPLITAQVSDLASLGSPKKVLENDYPEFNFENLVECQKIPWYLRELSTQKLYKISKLQNPAEFIKNGIFQDHFEFRLRLQRFEKQLKNHLEKQGSGKRILIISHEEVFCSMTAKFFKQDGQSSSDLSFTKGQINFVSSAQVFHPLSPPPTL